MIFFLIYLCVAAVWGLYSVKMEKASPEHYQGDRSLTFILNFVLFPIAIIIAIIFKRLTIAQDKKFIRGLKGEK